MYMRLLEGIKLSISQTEAIDSVADTLESLGLERSWSELMFKQSHDIRNGIWVSKDAESIVIAKERDDGAYDITTVSTAAIEDTEGETFTTDAIDWDAAQAKAHNDYPEYRMFHSKQLGIGKVNKMFRAGIFAIDQGISYKDNFSLSVCKNILANNDGRWRCSRGFSVSEVSGQCSKCGKELVLKDRHMIAGFKCPNCDTAYLRYKSKLRGIQFKKTRTFDVTITDIPCNAMTGAIANKRIVEDTMTKEELKKKLLKAKIEEKDIDARLEDITDEQLKELDDIPFADVLKEFKDKPEPEKPPKEADSDETLFVLDPEVLKDFGNLVDEKIHKALEGLTIELPEEMELKEIPGLEELKEQVTALTEAVNALLEKDEERLKQLLDASPRQAKLRIQRFKSKKPIQDEGDEEDLTDIEEGDEEDVAKNLPKWLAKEVGYPTKKTKSLTPDGAMVFGSEGKAVPTLTEFMTGGVE
jgi:predicted RNA-binding Zn-ribbon protein involved in translation (DUF1610 family)